MIDRAHLQRMLEEYGFSCSGGQAAAFDRYAALLAEWNRRINLTAILEPEEICVKHFLDSALLLSAAEPEPGASLIDVGTGAGFPAVPCKILRPDLSVTLLDSLNKRVGFLTELSRELGQDNAAVHGRAEELGRAPEYRERFDLAAARPAIRLLGGEVEAVKKYELPMGARRAIVLIRKISQTPTKYPRLSAKIKKEPLGTGKTGAEKDETPRKKKMEKTGK